MVPFSPSSGSLACRVVTSVPGGTRSGTCGDTQLTYSCLLPFLKSEWSSPHFLSGRAPLVLLLHLFQKAVSLTYTYNSIGRPPFLISSSGQDPVASHTCTGRPPPAAPEVCRKVGLLSLRSSTAMCTVPVVLRGGLPESCTCTRSW